MTKYSKIIILALLFFSTASLMAQDGISADRKQAIDSLAMEKVKDLSKYISIIGNKQTSFSEANRVIDRTLELFAPNSQIGVSSLYIKEIKYYTIRKYLNRLMALNYDEVTISWYNIQYISDLEPQPDGTYVGVITIYQRFEGKKGDDLTYVDTTKKDITVYVKRKETQIGGRTIGFWDVMLGDIRVAETSK